MRKSLSRRAALRRMVESCEPRRLLAAVSWDGGGDGTTWTDPNNWSNNALPNSSDDVTIDVAANPTIVLTSSQSIRSLVNRETLRLNAVASSITLSVSTTVSNFGRIELTSTNSNTTGLSLSGELTNAAGGTLTALLGGGGARNVNATSIVNAGTLSAADNISLTTSATNTTITGGSLTAGTTNSLVRLSSTNYTQSGGAVTGRVQVSGANLTLSGPATGTLTAVSSNTLVGHNATGLTLNVQYDPSFGSFLTIASDQTLAGPITMDTLTSSAPSISIAANRTFTVGAAGSITAIGSGAGTSVGRTISGSTNSRLVNNGTIRAIGGAQLSVSSLTVDQQGTLSTTDVGSRLAFSSNTFKYLGGTHSGNVLLSGSNAISLVDAANQVSLRVVGSNTLVRHDAAEITLDLVYDVSFAGSLSVTSDLSVSGPITMTTQSTGAPSISIGAGYTLTIAPGGSITATGSDVGTTASRTISGSTNAVMINNGTIAATGGAQLAISSLRFTQNGLLTASGVGSQIHFSSNRFTYAGGTHSGEVALAGSNSVLLLNSNTAQTLSAFSSNTLLQHDAQNLTLELLANSSGSSLNVPLDLSISGPISMRSITTSQPTLTIDPGTTLTLQPTASITALGSGAGTTLVRTINGSTNSRLVNGGTIQSSGGAQLTLNSLNLDNNGTFLAAADSAIDYLSATLTQQGTINASAANSRIRLSSARLDYLNGTHSGNFEIVSSSLFLVDATSAQVLNAFGGNTLLGHTSTDLTLNILYHPSFGGSLTVSSDQTLGGAITLTTISTGTPVLTVSGGYTLTVSSAGSISATGSDAGTAQTRTINGSTNSRIVNNGLIRATGGSSLTISSMRIDNNGTLRAETDSILVLSSTRLDQSGSLVATAAGALLDISGGTLNYLAGTNTGNVFASSTSLNLVAASSPVTLITRGSSTLLRHDAANLILNVRYDVNFGATLTISADQTLNGAIQLGSVGTSGSSIQLSAATLTISPTGSITAIAPETGTNMDRSINASTNSLIINNGLIAATGGANLTVNSARVDNNATVRADANSVVSFTSGILNQKATLDASAAASSIRVNSGTFNYLDGTHSGEVAAISSSIRLVGADAAGIVRAFGNNTLLEHSTGILTLNVRYHSQFGGSVRIGSDLSLSGPITLDTLTNNQPSLSIDPGWTLTVTAAGSITSLGTPSDTTTNLRQITGSTNARLINLGSISAIGGSRMTVSVPRVEQRAALSTSGADSRLTFSSGTLSYLNGSNTGNVYVTSERLRLVNATAPSRLIGVSSVTLLEHLDSDLTLEMLGGTLFNEADLTLLGPVILSSSTEFGGSSFSIAAGTDLTIAPTGSIAFVRGETNSLSRSISGSTNTKLINNGLLAIESGLSVSLSTDSITPMLNAGTILIDSVGSDATVFSVSAGSGQGILNAASGTMRKTGDGSATVTVNLFENKGLVDILGGTLRFPNDTNIDDANGAFLSGGIYRVANGATLGFSTAPSLRPSINTADVEVTGTGTVEFGRLSINRGRLALDGGADLTLDPDGATRFINEGIFDLSPGSDLTIEGGLDFAGTSQPVIRTELASASSFGRLLVNGSINLNSPNSANRFDPDLVNGYDPALNARHDVIIATGGITNGFDSFQGGLTPSNRVLRATRPNANTVAVEVGPGPLPPPPQVLSQAFDFETREAIVFNFNQDVSAFLGRKDYQLVNLTTNTPVPSTVGILTYNTTSNQAVLTFTNELPDGNYRLTVNASDIANSSGVVASGSPIVLNFHILKGDANRDRAVTFDDLLIVAQNYGQDGKTFSQGNFNYDAQGSVGFDDLLILAQRYGTSVVQTSISASTRRESVAKDLLA